MVGDESDEGGSENRDGIGNGNRNGDGNNDEGLGDSEIEEAQRGTSWGEPAFCLQLYSLRLAGSGLFFCGKYMGVYIRGESEGHQSR